jgi:hypothetical protein
MGKIGVLASLVTVALLVGTLPIGEISANPTTMSWFRITIESPKDITYYPTNTIALNISIEVNEIEPGNTSYYYKLDNADYRNSSVNFMEFKGKAFGEFNGTYFVNGSTVLPSLSIGKHRVTVFRGGNDSYGHWGLLGTAASVDFTIEPEPSPTNSLVLAITIPIAAISLAFLVFFKKRKSKTLIQEM